MRRREFIKVLAGSAAAWPLATRAQQPERMKRIGVLLNFAEDDREAQAQNLAFLQSLQQLGWTDGRVIDFNQQTMRYFDPSLQLGVVHNVKITPLPGNRWAPGPISG